jgi:hypothetical protein
MAQVKTSPFSGFCWKNVWHWALGLALLPFAVAGVQVVMNAVHSVLAIFAVAAK